MQIDFDSGDKLAWGSGPRLPDAARSPGAESNAKQVSEYFAVMGSIPQEELA
jgi:hypothetical protein